MFKQRNRLLSLVVLVALFCTLFTFPAAVALPFYFSGEGFSVQYTTNDTGTNTYAVECNITNTSSETLTNWAIGFPLSETSEISNIWSADVALQNDGYAIIKNAGWNANIAPGATVNFGMQLDGSEETPATFSLCRPELKPSTDTAASFSMLDESATTFFGQFTIQNCGNVPISNWTVGFNCTGTIQNVDSANLISQNGLHYVVCDAGWNGELLPGETAVFSIFGTTNGQFEISDSVVFSSEFVTPNQPIASPCTSDDPDGKWIEEDSPINFATLENLVDEGELEISQTDDGRVRAVVGKFDDSVIQSAEDVATLLMSAKSLFGSSFSVSSDDVVTQSSTLPDQLEENFYRFTPRINGIPAVGSQIVLSTDEAGVITGLFNSYDKRIESVDTVPMIEAQEAVEMALAEFAEDEIQGTAELVISTFEDNNTPRLLWVVSFNDGLNVLSLNAIICANGLEAGNLVWKSMDADWVSSTVSAQDYLSHWRSINLTEDSGVFYLHDQERKIKVTSFSEEPLQANSIDTLDKSGISALANMESTYDYYKDFLGCDSYDNAAHEVRVAINQSTREQPYWDNAAWQPAQQRIAFGNTGHLDACLDVAAHEYTHAVVYNILWDGTPNYPLSNNLHRP